MALLGWPLVFRANSGWQPLAAERPSNRWHRVARFVNILVSLLLRGRDRIQRTVSAQAIRASRRVQVILCVLRACQRPVVFVAPLVLAHHKNSDRLLFVDTVLFTFQQP